MKRKIIEWVITTFLTVLLAFVILLGIASNIVESRERCIYAEAVNHLETTYESGVCYVKLPNGKQISLKRYIKFKKEIKD